jgi:hypothetical protein
MGFKKAWRGAGKPIKPRGFFGTNNLGFIGCG